MAVPARKVDCTHLRADHKHGTYLAYAKDGCRCEPCKKAYSAHGKRTHYRTQTQGHSYVDAGRARAHVLALLEVLTIAQVEKRSQVHRTAIRCLIGEFPGRPMSKRISRTTQDALLSVQPVRLGDETSGWVDRTGSQRRLRALVALGWNAKYLSTRLGTSTATVHKLLYEDGKPVLASTRNRVHALYEELAMVIPPPSRHRTRSRGIAARRGWLPPLAWDDIDDPNEVPVLKETADATQVFVEEFNDTYWEHRGDTYVAAQRLGYTIEALERRLFRAKAKGLDIKPFICRREYA